MTLGEKDRFDGSLDALMVIGPRTALSAKEIKAVDQFLMEGKSVALFLDSERVDLQPRGRWVFGSAALLVTSGLSPRGVDPTVTLLRNMNRSEHSAPRRTEGVEKFDSL